MSEYGTREEWLEAAVRLMARELFRCVVPAVRVSVGWPTRRAAIGECWAGEAAVDGLHQIFVSPGLSVAVDVLGVLVHELCHACLPSGSGHGAHFSRLAKAVGLRRPWKATTPGPALVRRFEGWVVELGPYPHARLDRCEGAPKAQRSRQIKCACEGCGYVARVTRKWLSVGAPICPTCGVALSWSADGDFQMRV